MAKYSEIKYTTELPTYVRATDPAQPLDTVASMEHYTNLADLPATSDTVGNKAFITSTNKLYIWSGVGWYLVAEVTNASPSSITGVNSTYGLASDGTATTITAVATDPEGMALTWSSSVTAGSLNGTTVANADNVFTITPHASNATTFSITFSVTDGVNSAVSSVSAFTLSFGTWEAPAVLATFTPPTYLLDAHYPQFGRRAKISSDGNTVVVSTSGVAVRSDSSVGGEAYIYVTSDSGTTWTLQHTFSPTQSTTEQYMGVGDSLAISADGNTIAVAHSDYTDGSITYAGRVFVLSRTGTTWSTQQTLMRSGTNQQYQYYGKTIDLSDDGNTLAVGSNRGGTNDGGKRQNTVAYNAGEVSILTRSGTTWTEQTVFSGSDSVANDQFNTVCLSGDGSTLAVAAHGQDSAGTNAGKIYIYKYNGTSWANSVGSNEEHTITTTNYQFGESSYYRNTDNIGYAGGWNGQGEGGGSSNNALSLSYDGNTFAWGAVVGSSGGFVNVWTRSGTTWTHQQHIRPASYPTNGSAQTYRFGTVTLDAAGDKLIIGALGELRAFSSGTTWFGAAYTYLRSGSTWTEHERIVPSFAAGVISEAANFGHNVSMTGDGTQCLISADGLQNVDGVGNGVYSGSAYSYANIGRVYLYKEGV